MKTKAPVVIPLKCFTLLKQFGKATYQDDLVGQLTRAIRRTKLKEIGKKFQCSKYIHNFFAKT
jgi:hypothetical protein